MVSTMKIRSISVPIWQSKILNKMKQEGIIVSFSEYLRKALDNQLAHDYVLIKDVVHDNTILEMIEEVIPEVLESPTTITINGRVWQKQ